MVIILESDVNGYHVHQLIGQDLSLTIEKSANGLVWSEIVLE